MQVRPVRCCPRLSAGTAHDWCEWHGGGTASEDDPGTRGALRFNHDRRVGPSLERDVRRGSLSAGKPYLNPLAS